MSFSQDFNFAPLNQSQLDQIKNTENTLNSGHSENDEVILIAFQKNS